MGQHWRKAKAKGQRLEACIAIGRHTEYRLFRTAKIPYDFDEYRLAGGWRAKPVEVVQAKSVDLLVPATAEIIIEGTIPTDVVEPEGPFGEYPGYMGHRTVSPFLEVTCITQRKDAIYTALMSQFRRANRARSNTRALKKSSTNIFVTIAATRRSSMSRCTMKSAAAGRPIV
jgi:UbiD family decarboxylase